MEESDEVVVGLSNGVVVVRFSVGVVAGVSV